MTSKIVTALICSAVFTGLTACGSEQTEQIRIVGSSTVYPFTTSVATNFGKTTEFPIPVIESTGTGGGFKLFCAGVGEDTADFSNASRPIKNSEYELCHKNGVDHITEIKIGYDGIVLANAIDAPEFALTLRDLYLAVAKEVPADVVDGAEPGTFVANPFMTWDQINPDLPNVKIEVMGPPPTSGTRDAFNELGIEAGCLSFDWIAELEESDGDLVKAKCRTLREDGGYIVMGENDNLIVQKLDVTPTQLGVFGYSFLDQNRDKVKAARINGTLPEFEKISSGEYPLARSLYIYVKGAHADTVPGMRGFIREYTSEGAWGPNGYLIDKGLIPLPEEEREQQRRDANNLARLSM